MPMPQHHSSLRPSGPKLALAPCVDSQLNGPPSPPVPHNLCQWPSLLLGRVVAIIDFLRAQLSCVLCVLNLLLLFAGRALATSLVAADRGMKNLDAMQRQVVHAFVYADAFALGHVR
jgi:hypothetical protein